MKLSFLFASLLFGCPVAGQVSLAERPRLAQELGLTFALPSLAHLRYDSNFQHGFQPTHLRWVHDQGDFELLFFVEPMPTDSTWLPLVTATRNVVHCSSNDEADFIGRFKGGREDLERLGATWAYFWDYAPKPAFSSRRRCYQASYFLTGRGLVTAWLLYDDPGYLHSDWVYVLPFDE